MSTYSPPPFPRRPKQSTILSELVYNWELAYYRYEINTGLYVMSPGEKLAFNISLVSTVILLISASYCYLPSAILVSIQRLTYYFTGSRTIVSNLLGEVTSNLLSTSDRPIGVLEDLGLGVAYASAASVH